ncbi:MAG: Gfo/Idh/MocA family oxidoreductase [Clostridia bacterium]|nr:Gfo/Idh/MocA family oxidoreductase [Clostridia bacterium]
MKWCVIGAGGIADRRTIPAILKDEKSTLVALMDKVPETAKAVGEKYGVEYFTDEETMLKSVECDAVYIGTPVFKHYEQAMLALKYDKHVFVEKPIAMNAKEGAELAEAFKKNGKLLCVGYMMKYHNLHEKAKALIKDGAIGSVNSVRAQFTCWYPEIKGAWRQTKALGGGGAIMDLGVHCIELIEDVLGEEIVDQKAFYSTKTFSYEVEDGAVIIFKTASGTLGHIDVNFNVPDNASESKFELYGTKGYIICSGTLAQEEKGVLKYLYSPQGDYVAAQNRETEKPQEFFGEESNLYMKQIVKFREAVESGKLDYFYTDRAVQVQEVVEKIYNEK